MHWCTQILEALALVLHLFASVDVYTNLEAGKGFLYLPKSASAFW